MDFGALDLEDDDLLLMEGLEDEEPDLEATDVASPKKSPVSSRENSAPQAQFNSLSQVKTSSEYLASNLATYEANTITSQTSEKLSRMHSVRIGERPDKL